MRPPTAAGHAVKFALLALLAMQTACTTTAPPPPEPTAANPCPPWVEFPLDRHSNAESPYLGCSNDVNLRATLDDPADLQRGRALGPADGAHASIAVGEYQSGQLKPLPASEPQTPTIVLGNGGGAAQ